MPQAISEFSSKAAVSLYLLLQKSAVGLSLSRGESKKLDDDFKSYMEHHWGKVLGDGGVLQGMKDLETRPLDSEAFDVRHKVTKLDLAWNQEDTAAATDCANALVKMIRYRDNDPSAKQLTNSDYLKWITFEVRYRCALESRPPKKIAAPPVPRKG